MRLLLGAALLVAATVPAYAERITPDQVMRHIQVLASDGYEGRASGTAGGERTEAYILEAFASVGLKPGAGGGWRQVVAVTERMPLATQLSFRRAGKDVGFPGDAAVLTGNAPTETLSDLPVVFAGHATDRSLRGQPIKGAVVVMLQGQPPYPDSKPSWQDRRKTLLDAGAAVVISIEPADRTWNPAALRSRGSVFPSAEPRSGLQGAMSYAAAKTLLGASLVRDADRPGFKAKRLSLTMSGTVTTRVDRLSPANIVGMIKGTGSSGEAVVLMSHWDHTGICRPAGAADTICNGAVDNASGVAVLIETARALATGPRPVRDIYFLATALEEKGGFLGAAAFAGTPGVRPVAVLNVDSIAIAPKGLPVAIIGRGRFPSLDRVIDSTATSLGRKVDLDEEANVMIERQDGWAFTKLGIPSVMASGSFSDMKLLQSYLASSYHQPNDDLNQKIELGGAVEDADLHVALARALADPRIHPTP